MKTDYCLAWSKKNFLAPFFYTSAFFSTFLGIIVALSSCKGHKALLTENPYLYKYDYGSRFKNGLNYDPRFGVHQIFLDSALKIIFLDSDLRINIVPIKAEYYSRIIDFSTEVRGLNYYSVRITTNRLYLFDVINMRFIIYKLNSDKIEKLNSINLQQLYAGNGYSISFQYNNCFEVDSGYLYLPYSMPNAKLNFLDTNAYLKVRFSESDSAFKFVDKFLSHPKAFLKRGYRSTYGVLSKLDDSVYLYGFEGYDSLFKYNSKRNVIIQGERLKKKFTFRKFDTKKRMDLSYIKWYDQTIEFNFKFLISQNKNIFILKRLQREDVKSDEIYYCYILNKNLKIISEGKIKHTVSPFFCFPVGNGFLVFDKLLQSAYYYEI